MRGFRECQPVEYGRSSSRMGLGLGAKGKG